MYYKQEELVREVSFENEMVYLISDFFLIESSEGFRDEGKLCVISLIIMRNKFQLVRKRRIFYKFLGDLSYKKVVELQFIKNLYKIIES